MLLNDPAFGETPQDRDRLIKRGGLTVHTTLDPLLHAGAYYVQEASSMFVEQAITQVADLSQPLRVLDLCGAPGGKSTLLASLISTDSLLVSNEVIRSRATRSSAASRTHSRVAKLPPHVSAGTP